MKNIYIVECKKCGQQYNGDAKEVVIKANESIDVIIKRVSRCSGCSK